MKYALYRLEDLIVTQWQDTDLFSYGEVSPWNGRVLLDDNALPGGFDPYNWPAPGWWVYEGAVTQIAPPTPLPMLARTLRYAATARRANGVAAGVVLADNSVFAPTDLDLAHRIMPIALGHATLGIAGIDLQSGGSEGPWTHYTAAGLEDAYVAMMLMREALFSAERVHLEAIAALLAANDRAGLESYDVTAGWPATGSP